MSVLRHVLDRLDGTGLDPDSIEQVDALFSRWCHTVPYDTTPKLEAVAANSDPHITGAETLERWLAVGAGGTCFALATAWHLVLDAAGVTSEVWTAHHKLTADAARNAPSHATVVATIAGDNYLFDPSFVHTRGVLLDGSHDPTPAWSPCTVTPGAADLTFTVGRGESTDTRSYVAVPADPTRFVDQARRASIGTASALLPYWKIARPDSQVVIAPDGIYTKTTAGVTVSPVDQGAVTELLRAAGGTVTHAQTLWEHIVLAAGAAR
jgi:hypothetical protein